MLTDIRDGIGRYSGLGDGDLDRALAWQQVYGLGFSAGEWRLGWTIYIYIP
jgi:hypothetical protein